MYLLAFGVIIIMNLSINHSNLSASQADARLATVLADFESLPMGGWLDLTIEAQELASVRQQLEAQWPGQFDWQPLASERLRLSRKPAAKSGCCGCCGGGGPKSNAVA